MPQVWKEKLDPSKHRDYMSGAQDAGGRPILDVRDNLIEVWVYFARTPDCELQFITRDQVVMAREYFTLKIHPARREWNNGLEHYWQRWFERLPPGVHREPNRKRILQTLDWLIQGIDSNTLPERN